MSEGHALLSASSAHRWLNCTPSARFAEQFENKSSVYAQEGTLAHSVAESMLKGLEVKDDITPAMKGYVKKYVEYCTGVRDKYPDGVMLVEQRLALSRYVPKSFGTADCLILSREMGTLEVIDLKYGIGVQVEADNNPQLMLYGLGCLEIAKANDIPIETVIVTIFQPRLQHVSSYRISRKDLEAWGIEIMPTAIKAFYGDGEVKSADWCRFCPAKIRCRAYADKFKRLSKMTKLGLCELSDDDVAEMLDIATELSNYINNLKEEIKQIIISGGEAKGYTLKEIAGQRILTPQAVEYLEMIGVDTTEEKQRSISRLKSIYGGKYIDEAIDGLTLEGPPQYRLIKQKDNIDEVFKDI